MEIEIRQKIVTALAGVSGITGGIHFDITGDSPSTPYVRFWTVAEETTRDTTKEYLTMWIQFDVIEDSKSPANVETIGNDIFDALEGNALADMTNWTSTHIYCLHRPIVSALDQNKWMSFINTKFEFEHK